MEKQNKDKIVEAICFSLGNSWISWRIPMSIAFRRNWKIPSKFLLKNEHDLKILKQFLDEFHRNSERNFIRFSVSKTDGFAIFFYLLYCHIWISIYLQVFFKFLSHKSLFNKISNVTLCEKIFVPCIYLPSYFFLRFRFQW